MELNETTDIVHSYASRYGNIQLIKLCNFKHFRKMNFKRKAMEPTVLKRQRHPSVRRRQRSSRTRRA